MKKNKNSIKNIIFRCLLILCLAFFIKGSANADEEVDIDSLKASISEKENELKELEKEKKNIQAGKTNAQKVINGLKANKQELAGVVQELDNQVASIQTNIDNYNTLIADKTAEIETAKQELEAAEIVVENQYNAMKARIRFMYETGETFYLEMLMDSQSFGEMLNKADYIEQLAAYDRKMLEEYTLTVQYTEMCKQELEEEEAVLEEAKTAAEEEQQSMNALIEEKEQQIIAYENDINTKEQAIEEYDAELAAQNEIIQALEAQVAAEKEELADATTPKYSGGEFVWPAPQYKRISDDYGWRMHPTLGVKKFHNGLDMAAPGGSPILAAADGKVAAAGYSSSMGNYIMIDHGGKLYTIYMHASALYVSKGAVVTAGQKIAAVGTTGRSTGNHLHFGVRLNGEYVNPYNYL